MFFFIIIVLIILIIINTKNNVLEKFENNEIILENIINKIKKINFLTKNFDFKNNVSLIIHNFIRYFENDILIKNNLYDYKFLKTDKLIINFTNQTIKFNFYINTNKKKGYTFETFIIKNNNNYIIEYIKKINYGDLSNYILEKSYNYYGRIGYTDDVGKKVSVEKDIIDNILNNKKIEKNKIKYRCINSYGDTENECEREYDKYGRLKKEGVWDKPCIVNDDCPFYKKNTNYDNERGGCIKGYCELPLGMKLSGFRKYDKNYKPICNNCKNDNVFCCDEQKNKNKYPNLKSPDYLF